MSIKHKQVRNNVFECNSSSSHSLTIDNSYTGKNEPDLRFPSMVYGGEFGWEFRKFNDFKTKASYLWSIVCDYDFENTATHEYFSTHYPDSWSNLKCLYDNLKLLETEGKLRLIEKRPEEYWYVDHGFEHWDNYVKNYPVLKTPEGIWEFLTKSSYWVFLGNDNSTPPPGFHYTPNQYTDNVYYVKVDGVENMSPLKNPEDKEELKEILREAAYYVAERKGYDYNREIGYMMDPTFTETHIIMPYKTYIDDEEGNFKEYKTTKTEQIGYVIIGPKN